MRSELLDNALKFLQDPQVQKSSLSKRIAFLESKGLSPDEIDLALKTASQSENPKFEMPTSPPPQFMLKQNSFNWNKFFLILAILSSAIVALSHTVISKFPVIQKLKKYLLPNEDKVKRLESEIESLKSNLNLALRQVDRDFESVREEIESLKK